MKSKRQSTVEPVFGTLTQFMGMRKINTIGIQQANKVMLMAGAAYNLKKLLKFTQQKVNNGVGAVQLFLTGFILHTSSKLLPCAQLNIKII